MDFMSIAWADSDLEKIQIEYDVAILTIWNFTLKKRFLVNCFELAGITDLCIWDDTIIMSAEVTTVTDANNEFLRKLFTAYNVNYDYGGRFLNSGLLELKVELSNYISFKVYCLKIDVQLSEDQRSPYDDLCLPFSPNN